MPQSLQNIVSMLLDPLLPAHTLRPEVLALVEILADAQAAPFERGEDISRGETRTSSGLALSPTMAAMCADDFVRTIRFLRGAHAAIANVRKRFPHRAALVLYAGCGPYATLAVPLLSMYSAADVEFTLLDVHSQSIASAKSIVETLGLSGSVSRFESADACAYKIEPDRPPDVILLEMMQACLEGEPQVAATRHLLRQAPDVILIPEQVQIDLVFVDPAREFDLGRSEEQGESMTRERIHVGTLFEVNRQMVKSWEGESESGDRLPAATVRIPEPLEPRFEPMLFTTIRVYQDEQLCDYDSGLTCPRRLSFPRALRAGESLKFHYQVGGHPQLIAEEDVAEKNGGN